MQGGTGPWSSSERAAALEYLFSTEAIRERCAHVLAAVERRQSRFFLVDMAAMDACADLVVEVTRNRYPDLRIPYHSRWRHFEAGGVDRRRLLDAHPARAGQDRHDRARSEIDLAVTSVLLDAGAGADWRFDESAVPDSENGIGAVPLARSEGLGVASWHLFTNGSLSGDRSDPLRADAVALERVTTQTIVDAFQVSAENPLVGLPGRVELLRRLGAAINRHPAAFAGIGRPGGLYDRLTVNGTRTNVAAGEILAAVLHALASIWPSDNRFDGYAVGDCWPHRLAGGSGPSAGWVPLHKLSQWMTYSLLEPFERAGVTITDLDSLTALAEYRNGGLFIDCGVIGWLDSSLARASYRPADEAIVEWRALTVALMPMLAHAVRERLGLDANTLPLAKILEGGTWAAGRHLAALRRGGLPPIDIESDGTVF